MTTALATNNSSNNHWENHLGTREIEDKPLRYPTSNLRDPKATENMLKTTKTEANFEKHQKQLNRWRMVENHCWSFENNKNRGQLLRSTKLGCIQIWISGQIYVYMLDPQHQQQQLKPPIMAMRQQAESNNNNQQQQ